MRSGPWDIRWIENCSWLQQSLFVYTSLHLIEYQPAPRLQTCWSEEQSLLFSVSYVWLQSLSWHIILQQCRWILLSYFHRCGSIKILTHLAASLFQSYTFWLSPWKQKVNGIRQQRWFSPDVDSSIAVQTLHTHTHTWQHRKINK